MVKIILSLSKPNTFQLFPWSRRLSLLAAYLLKRGLPCESSDSAEEEPSSSWGGDGCTDDFIRGLRPPCPQENASQNLLQAHADPEK